MQIDNYNLETEQEFEGTIQQSDYRIRLKFLEETYADSSFNPYFMVNSAYAAIDCEDAYVGLEYDIVEFSITCNRNILNTVAGEPIDYENLNVYSVRFVNDEQNFRLSIEEWLDVLDNGGNLLDWEWFFEFTEPIVSNEDLKFKIKIKPQDETEFEIETNAIIIQ